jgi:hypothetical protein
MSPFSLMVRAVSPGNEGAVQILVLLPLVRRACPAQRGPPGGVGGRGGGGGQLRRVIGPTAAGVLLCARRCTSARASTTRCSASPRSTTTSSCRAQPRARRSCRWVRPRARAPLRTAAGWCPMHARPTVDRRAACHVLHASCLSRSLAPAAGCHVCAPLPVLLTHCGGGGGALQNGSLMCRFAAPTAWNFYHIIRFACKPCIPGRIGKCDAQCEWA